MASVFTHRPKLDHTGIPWDVWCRTYLEPSTWKSPGNLELPYYDANGKLMPRRRIEDLALVLVNPKPVRGTEISSDRSIQVKGNRGGAAWFYSMYPRLVLLKEAFSAPAFNKSYNGLTNCGKKTEPWVMMPLGSPCNSESKVVMKQLAREWVSGCANNADMHDAHVTNFYFSALAGALFQAAGTKTPTEQELWIGISLALWWSFTEFSTTCPEAKTIITAFAQTLDVQDVLQALCAQLLCDLPTSKNARLRCLELGKSRNKKWGAAEILHQPQGLFATFILVPLMKRTISGNLTVSEIHTEFSKRCAYLCHVLSHCVSKTPTATVTDACILFVLAQFSEADLTIEQAMRFSIHTNDSKTLDRAPFDLWGATTKERAPWNLVTDGIKVEKRFVAPVVVSSDAKRMSKEDACRPSTCAMTIPPEELFSMIQTMPMTETKIYAAAAMETKEGIVHSCNFKASTPTEWSGIGLTLNGTYRITGTLVGLATLGTGKTLGKELNANLRVTLGFDIMPRTREGFSSSGMRYDPKQRRYVNDGIKFDPTHPIEIVVDNTSVNVKNVVKFQRIDVAEPVMIGFKNLNLDISFLPPTVPLKNAADLLVESLAQKDLTPCAVMKAMTDVAIERAKSIT